MPMRPFYILASCLSLFICCSTAEKKPEESKWKLVWSDEFGYSGLPDSTKWNYDVGGHGWGNNELQFYTKNRVENARVEKGFLIIEARKESWEGKNYTSARLITKGKGDWQYGKIEVRAKLPKGVGTWPAIWMLGSTTPLNWPDDGEIDIMELVGTNPNRITGTMHWSVSGADALKNANYTLAFQDFSKQFHVFSIVWQQDSISWYVDDNLYLSTTSGDVGSANYPFNADQFLIFNVAVGGNWPGAPDDSTIFPQRMFVDYVRVFQ